MLDCLLTPGTPHWRRNLFWMLIALSCTLWMVGLFQWTYYEVYLHKSWPDLFPETWSFFFGVFHSWPLSHCSLTESAVNFSSVSAIWILFCFSLGGCSFTFFRSALDVCFAEPRAIQLQLQCCHEYSKYCRGRWLGILWLRTTGAWRNRLYKSFRWRDSLHAVVSNH